MLISGKHISYTAITMILLLLIVFNNSKALFYISTFSIKYYLLEINYYYGWWNGFDQVQVQVLLDYD